MSEKQTVGGIPVECLTGESAAIWSGWRMLGDREVVREASAKGTYINLAYKYLAYRKNCTIDKAKIYFNEEVELWIRELINKCQVHRASHILKNIGKDPTEHIFKVCIKTKEPFLREYLCDYMINVNGFNETQKEAWDIIQSILQYEKKSMLENLFSNIICIEDIINLPENIKQALCTELYIQLFEPKLIRNTTSSVVWNCLLLYNKIDTIKYWIDKRYNTNAIIKETYEINENFKELVDNLIITPEMIEQIDLSDANNLIKELTKNHLCKYGIFTKTEQDNLKLTLARIFSSQLTLKDFQEILSYESCNINKNEFLENININYYLTQQNHSIETMSEGKNLYNTLNKMHDPQCNVLDTVTNAILQNIHYISDNFTGFLKDNYLITFALVFLQYCKIDNAFCSVNENVEPNNDDFKNMFNNEHGLQIGANIVPYEILCNTLKHIPIIRRIMLNESKKNDITVYELLDGCQKFTAKQFFKWRYNNEPMPHFSNESLVKRYGYQETLTYAYYLKEERPNMAFYTLKNMQGKPFKNISSRMKCKAAFYAHCLALKNLHKSELVCSCISFLEMVGINSEILRLHITAADYVQKHLNISIGPLLESIMFKNQVNLQTVILYLEKSFQSYLNDSTISENTLFFDALRIWEFIIQFARTHDSSLPDTLLKYLAQKDLWFEFVLVGHIFNYPTSQILTLAKEFQNINIREHLLTCFNTESTSILSHPKYETKLKFRDVRQFLYCKIGLKQTESTSSSASSSLTESSSSDTYSTASEKISLAENIYSSDDDLWMTFLKCHHSQDPPGALLHVSRITLRPILIILATCYEPSLTTSYCYSWMVISTANKSILSDYAECLDQIMWPANKVLELIPRLVSSGYVCTLSRAFQIFMPDNILNPFFEFLVRCINYGEFIECQQYLKDFKTQSSMLICSKIVNWESVDNTYLKNFYWIAILVIKCIVVALAYNFRSTQLQIHFLNALVKCNFHCGLPVDTPDFQNLLNITKVLLKTEITLNFAAFTVTDNVYNYNQEITRCINCLVERKDYINALQICSIAALDTSEIILAQYRNEFEHYSSTKSKLKKSFWKRCTDDFKKYNVPSEKAAEFLVEHAEKVLSHKERYEILKFAFETLKDSQIEQQTIDTLEMAMWKSCILIGPNNVLLEYEDEILKKLKTELLSGLNKLQVTCTLADANEESAAEYLINKLIDAGKLDVALRISTIFNYKHRDLQVLLLCLSLAEGELLYTELTLQQKDFLIEGDKSVPQKYSIFKNRGLQRLSSSSSSINTIGTESGKTVDVKSTPIRQNQIECMSMLEKLMKTLRNGVDTGSRIFLCYKLAIRLGKSYQSLIKLDEPVQLLQEVTDSNIDNKFETANDIIIAYKIKSNEIASFLTKNIVDSITKAIEDKQDDSIIMWGCPLDASFHLIMELCSDISILGLNLLETAHKLMGYSQGEKRNVSTLKTIVELLIRSHDCFTACCNMEGIASILRKCQNIANTLQIRKNWTLLVRLVTGVGRFTEMNYIFQILKENDQFEFLLGKSLHKVPGLKTALLEFLKRNCPENKELFTLVALHFRLYYEIALMWENEAKEATKELMSDLMKEQGKAASSSRVELKLIKTESLLQKLQIVVMNFTHAAQYYLQDNKLHLANKCCQQAQLVALQIALLNATSNQPTICILNLKTDQIDKILSETLNFQQALIVARAYNHHPDWANIIYSHFILNGEIKYLKDFITVIKLSSNITEDCARRYRSEKNLTNSMKNNMKTLISELVDVECKYMLASQLGFKEIVEVMLNSPATAAYLKDTVWKKGYKSS
ncbi:spatacsin [Polistes fuscatus]|uniref:spatacsin n=1 Tax=Polistes fuscatus TaxID=30207 RepID=UPI001CA9F198|nr:spatacsin [Polistes fuscatus]